MVCYHKSVNIFTKLLNDKMHSQNYFILDCLSLTFVGINIVVHSGNVYNEFVNF